MRSNNSRFNGGDLYPVETVSWDDTQKFINALNDGQEGKYQFRLPTEAEWEYAARSGGKPEMFSGGNNAKTVAWYQTNSRQSTQPVGQKTPNGLGIYDMSGNVWEWCQDLCGTGSYGRHTQKNPIIVDNASTRRVIRGGGYNSYARLVRCSQRWEHMPGVRDSNIGFRVAMDQQ
jgi:formylglycine-generating enzyme required for sulfatase activity